MTSPQSVPPPLPPVTFPEDEEFSPRGDAPKGGGGGGGGLRKPQVIIAPPPKSPNKFIVGSHHHHHHHQQRNSQSPRAQSPIPKSLSPRYLNSTPTPSSNSSTTTTTTTSPHSIGSSPRNSPRPLRSPIMFPIQQSPIPSPQSPLPVPLSPKSPLLLPLGEVDESSSSSSFSSSFSSSSVPSKPKRYESLKKKEKRERREKKEKKERKKEGEEEKEEEEEEEEERGGEGEKKKGKLRREQCYSSMSDVTELAKKENVPQTTDLFLKKNLQFNIETESCNIEQQQQQQQQDQQDQQQTSGDNCNTFYESGDGSSGVVKSSSLTRLSYYSLTPSLDDKRRSRNRNLLTNSSKMNFLAHSNPVSPANVEERADIESLEEELNEQEKAKIECEKKRELLLIELKLIENELLTKNQMIYELQWQKQTLKGTTGLTGIQAGLYKETACWKETEFEFLKDDFDELQRSIIQVCMGMSASGEAVPILQQILQTLSHLEDSTLIVASCAPRFDPYPGVTGNGYRSLLRVIQVAVLKALSQIKQGKQELERNPPHNLALYLSTLDDLFVICVQMINQTSTANIFPCRGYHGIISRLTDEIPLEIFYGTYFGLHFKKGLRRVLGALLIAMTSFGDGFEKGDFYDKMRAILVAPKYATNQKRSAKKVVDLFCRGDLQFLKSFWNLQETVIFVELDTAMRTPTPSVNLVFSIPVQPMLIKKMSSKDFVVITDRDATKIEADKPYNWLTRGRDLGFLWKDVLLSLQIWKHPTPDSPEIILQVTKTMGSSSDVLQDVTKSIILLPDETASDLAQKCQRTFNLIVKEHDKSTKGVDQLVLFSANSVKFSSVQARLLSSHSIMGQIQTSDMKNTSNTGRPLSKFLLFHLHGGGFIAHSSKAHQNYLRDYAKTLGCPILSVDYSLAPDAIFPQALNETFYAYCWCLKNPEKLGWSGECIVVTGDSAGGNLTVALTLMTIEKDIRRPDAIVPIYPALLGRLIPSASRLLSVMDPLLSVGALTRCLSAYTGKEETNDPYVSPLLADEKLLAQFPLTRMIVGDMDPLLDESIEFVKILRKLGVDSSVQILDDLPHGFLGFNRVSEDATTGTSVCMKLIGSTFDELRDRKTPTSWEARGARSEDQNMQSYLMGSKGRLSSQHRIRHKQAVTHTEETTETESISQLSERSSSPDKEEDSRVLNHSSPRLPSQHTPLIFPENGNSKTSSQPALSPRLINRKGKKGF